jgi:hypothetical protein
VRDGVALDARMSLLRTTRRPDEDEPGEPDDQRNRYQLGAEAN